MALEVDTAEPTAQSSSEVGVEEHSSQSLSDESQSTAELRRPKEVSGGGDGQGSVPIFKVNVN